MNILRLVVADKEKKSRSQNPEFQKIEEEAAACKNKAKMVAHFDEDELRNRLTPFEYFVTQEKGTERPFSGKHLYEKSSGLFTCIICEADLFRSEQKFDFGCGWPSFSDVITPDTVSFNKDTSSGISRVEVSCSRCGSHLGHVFDDGPGKKRLRYCVNSASLSFKKHSAV